GRSRRDMALSVVSQVVDRRSSRTRAIELLLADQSTLLVARTRPRSQALDRVAQELGDLLGKPALLASGALIANRFEIEHFVAQGGMGVVYRARDRASDEPVALKLALERSVGTAQQLRFAREMQLLASIDDRRIARYVSHGASADGREYLAMQWLD